MEVKEPMEDASLDTSWSTGPSATRQDAHRAGPGLRGRGRMLWDTSFPFSAAEEGLKESVIGFVAVSGGKLVQISAAGKLSRWAL